MWFIIKLKIYILLLIVILSCTFNRSDVIEIGQISHHKDPFDNELVARDIISYDYAKLFYEATQIKDERLKGNVQHNYFVTDEGKVSIRLNVRNAAIEFKDTLVTFFKNTVGQKINLHIEKGNDLHIAEERALDYKSWLAHQTKDSISANLSPLP